MALAPQAAAQITEEPAPQFPDPKKFASGLYTEGEVGALGFVGRASGQVTTGFALGGRVGYDLFRWLAVQVHLAGSTHQAALSNVPQTDQLLQIYRGTGELKVTFVLRQVSLFGFGGAGLALISSNLLETTGLARAGGRSSFIGGGGGGIDYHTLSRHFSFGLNGAYLAMPRIKASGAVTAMTYLRYTF